MKVTKKTTGEVFNATVIPGALLREGGKYALDDPEFPIRNGNQLQEQYFMGAVDLIEDNGRLVPKARVVSVEPDEPEEDTPPVNSLPSEKRVSFGSKKTVEIKTPPKKKGWPKGKKRGKRSSKARRADADSE